MYDFYNSSKFIFSGKEIIGDFPAFFTTSSLNNTGAADAPAFTPNHIFRFKNHLFTPTPTSTANAFLPPTMASTQAPKTILPLTPTLASYPASTPATTPTFILASTSAPIPIPMFALTFTTIYIFNF